ncbi:hypothetical protein D3C81_1044440 [compost metagenome]
MENLKEKLTPIVKQLLSCKYECEAGPLELNQEFVELMKLAGFTEALPVTHELKCVNPYYEHVVSGIKPFEIRKNDRNYGAGDLIKLMEYDPEFNMLTGKYSTYKITYVTDYEQKDGYVVLGIHQLIGGSVSESWSQRYRRAIFIGGETV